MKSLILSFKKYYIVFIFIFLLVVIIILLIISFIPNNKDNNNIQTIGNSKEQNKLIINDDNKILVNYFIKTKRYEGFIDNLQIALVKLGYAYNEEVQIKLIQKNPGVEPFPVYITAVTKKDNKEHNIKIDYINSDIMFILNDFSSPLELNL